MNATQLTSRATTVVAVFALLAGAANAQTLGCSTGGAAGVIPTSGTGGGGVYPTTFPPFETALPLSIGSVPPGATVVTEVKLNGLTHTFSGDLQFVLTAPSGARHNIFNRAGGGCDFGGNYSIVAECTGGLIFSTCPGAFPPGVYSQFFGTWPSGTNSVVNTPLSAIGAATGTWTLTIYDWAGGDVGAVASWDLCFGTPPVPTIPASAPTLLTPADGAGFCSNSVFLTWSAVACATSYDVELNGVVTTGVVGTSFNATITTPGAQTWRVRAANAAGVSAYSPSRSFSAGSVLGWACVPGGLGGSIPAGGAVDGSWPSVLPTGELSSTLAVTVPSGAAKITAVKLNGLTHSWLGDCHIVLTSPAGVNYNIFQEMDGAFGAGCADDFNGDYAFVDPITGTDECGNPALTFACGSGSPLAPGAYRQFYGMWNSGDAGILNVNLDSIPLASGNWTLKIYDWYVLADNGALTSWELCFDSGGGAPSVYCTAGTSTSGCVATISGTAQPSVSFANPCQIDVATVEGQKQGLLFYGVNNAGFTPLSWAPGSSSYLCVKAPTLRTGGQNSGGTLNQCDGSYTLDWNAFQLANPGALGAPFSVGAKAYVQAWYRDPAAPKTTNLSAGLELTYAP